MIIKTVALAAILVLSVLAEEQPKWGGNFEPSNADYLSLESNDPIGQGSTASNDTSNGNEIDKVIDTILISGRQGRNLDGFDEVYSDPSVQEVLQKGDDLQARNVIKDKLCSLGLMDCENEQIEGKRPFLPPGELIYSQPPPGYRKPNGPPNHYGPPKPMPPPNSNGNNFGPPRKVGYAYSPQQTFQTTQSFPGPVYHSKPPGPIYVESKPPGPFYEGPNPPGPIFQGGKPQIYEGPKPPGPIYSGDGSSPYKFENVVENYHHSHGKYEVANEFQGQAKPTIVVNAQGGAATTSGQSAAASTLNIHHHYHHIDEGASKTPVVVNNQIPVPAPQLVSGNGIGSSAEFSSNSGGFSPLSSGYEYNKYKQENSYSGSQFGSVNSGLGPVNGLSGNGVYGGGVKPVFEQSNSIGQTGFGSFDSGSSFGGNTQFGHSASGSYGGNGGSNTQYGQSVSGVYNGNSGSYHSNNPGYYKKALNTNGGANSLSYSQSGYKQQYAGQFGSSGNGDNYQGFESNRQDNFDCFCVPYDQCPSTDVIGRKDDLILPLDPRHLRTDIEAVDEETVTITDGNGTMTVVRVPKDTVDNKNTTNANTTTGDNTSEVKKISKRDVSEKKADAQEKADGEARQAFYQQRPQQCGPAQVCCRRPARQQKQNFGQCGRRNTQGITGRIKNPVYVDGDSEFGEYPWQVAILKKDPKESVYVCGGTLIDHQHILTAAHCVKTYTGHDLRIRLGEWDVNHDVEFFPYIERDVTHVIVHPEYYAGTLDNDLAILRLNVPVDFANAPHISPACLPDKFSDYTGQRCWTTGWGKDAFGDFGKYQNILKEVDVPIINQQQCQQQLRNTRLGYSYKLNPGFICAGGEEGKDACKGDGGGPMVCERNGSWQLVGVVSWGIGCGQVNVPGVYVRVSHYLDWIQHVTRGF